VFASVWNPSSTEVRVWAYDAMADEPCQDWDLALCWAGHERDYLNFAADSACPRRAFFLHIIYQMVGNAVRSQFRATPEPIVRGFIELAATSKNADLRVWRERSLRLLRHPSEFDYEFWCAYGHARIDARSSEADSPGERGSLRR